MENEKESERDAVVASDSPVHVCEQPLRVITISELRDALLDIIATTAWGDGNDFYGAWGEGYDRGMRVAFDEMAKRFNITLEETHAN